MSYYTLVVNDSEYTFDRFTVDDSKKEISIEGENHKFELLLKQWFDEGIDYGQGINPNYKKDIKIQSNNKIYCFERCWIKKYGITSAKAIICYD